MSDYIKREDAIDALYGYGKSAQDIIKIIHAADVVERKHGKWKTAYLDHEAFGVRPTAHYCSECHQIIAFRTFYCPNCGADMRGDSDV